MIVKPVSKITIGFVIRYKYSRIMKTIIRLLSLFIITLFFSSCGIIGIHFHDHNPRKAGRYPEFNRETVLLGELTPVRSCFDVKYYSLDISIYPKEKSVGGWVEIVSVAAGDFDSLQIDLDERLTIDSLCLAKRGGELLRFSRDCRAVYVKFPQMVRDGDLFNLHVKYHGKPLVASKPPWKGGMVWKKDKEKNDWIGVACESEGPSIWFPCKDHTSDEADSARLRFTIPDTSLMIVSNGILGRTENRRDSRSFTWQVHYPINTYNITFYAGNFAGIEDTLEGIGHKVLNINHYVLKPNRGKAVEHFRQVKDDIRAYERVWGEYPWYNDGFKLVESPYAGMEHQTAIAYGNRYKNDLNGTDDYIILHETGHEWFGNAVTAADFSDIWLQEGFTTYGEYLCLQQKYSDSLANRHLGFYRMLVKNKYPVKGPYGRRYFNYKDGDAYFKGAWILHTLRNIIGDDKVFLKILQTFYAENEYKLVDTKDFINVVNRIAGKDYTWFFDQYLNNNQVPFLEFDYYDDGTIYYRWANTPEWFNKMPVKITFRPGDKIYCIYPGTKIQKLSLPESVRDYENFSFDSDKKLYGITEKKELGYEFEKKQKERNK